MSAAGGVKKGERSVRTDPSSWAKRNFGAIHRRKPTGGRGLREAAVEDSASDLLCDTARCGVLPTGGGGRTVRRIGAACLLSLAALMGSLCLDLNSSLAGWRETEDALHALVSCRNTLSLQLIGRLQEERGSARKERNNKSRLTSSNLTQTAQVLTRVSALCTELRAGGQSSEGASFTCQQLVEGIRQNLGGNGTRHEDETDHIITSVISILLSGSGEPEPEPERELSRARANQDWADVMSFRLTLRAKEALLLRSQPRPSSQQGDPQTTWQWAATTLNHGLVISENMQQCCRKNMNLSLYFTQQEGVCLFYPSLRVLEAADQGVMLGVVHHLDILRECLLSLADDSMRKKSRDVLSALSYRITLLATACLIYPVVLVSFKQMTEWIQNYARSLKERTEDLSRQRRLAEDLLHQMLPKSVARQLRKHKHVEAESYEQVTIYFSDIVGFTTISASCTPLQVVQMLNSLYMCFDTRIESYDVYKVETIGDAYMVVSGLPERKWAKHADEIAKMALDLVAAVRQVPIPHMPTERLQLRAGIHTGPCVAGVVGYKMPRYCLFGDTVNTASRMESTSLPQKIHISSATFSCLMTDDDYEIELRGDTELKGKGKMKTYWLIGNKNYSVQNDSLVCHRNPRIKKRNENGESMASVQQSGTSSTAQTPSNRTTPLSLMEVSANGHPGTKSDCLQNADSQLALSSLKSSEHSESCSPNSEKGAALPDRRRGQEQDFYLRGTPAAESEPSTARRDGAQAAHEDRRTEKSEQLPGFVNLS